MNTGPQGPGAKRPQKRERRGIQLKDEVPPCDIPGTSDRPPANYANVKAAARNHWPEIHARLGIDPQFLTPKHGPCPGCGGKDRFTNDNKDGHGGWYCSGAGAPAWGDGFELLEHVHGWSSAEALSAVAKVLGLAHEQTGHPAPHPPAPLAAATPRGQPDKAAQYAAAALKAAKAWERATPAPPNHPYLVRAGIPPLIARVDAKGVLLVPIFSETGDLQSLERIAPDGDKKGFYQARKQGGWCEVQAGTKGGPIAVCEGYATGCTVAATMPDWRVIVAFSCANLALVASMLRTADPDGLILICGDDDSAKHPPPKRNPGRYFADLAAKAAGAVTLFPPVPGDWNDYSQAVGTEALREALAAGLACARAYNISSTPSIPSNQELIPSESLRDTFENSGDTFGAPAGSFPPGCLIEKRGRGSVRMIESAAAELVADALRDRVAYDPESVSWLLWEKTHWAWQRTAAAVEKLFADVVHSGTGTLGFRPGYLIGITQIVTRRGLLPPPNWPTGVVPFRNGLLDLETRALKPTHQGYALDWYLPHDWNPHATCPTILAWLSAAVDHDGETVELLRAWLAALARGIALHRVLFLIGVGGSGKSTFARLATALVGKRNSATSDLRRLEENRFELANVYGKRLLNIGEAGRYGGEISVLNKLSGGDELPLERKHVQQGGSFHFDGLVLIVSNEDVVTTDATSGLERRRVTVRFPRAVSSTDQADWLARGGEEAVLHQEMPGLIAWLLAMPVTEIHERLTALPSRVVSANLLGMAAGNSVAAWLMENCIPGTSTGQAGDPYCVQIGVRVTERDAGIIVYKNTRDRIYPNYLEWAEAENRKPVALRRFSDIVMDIAQKLGHSVVRAQHPIDRCICIYGLRLRRPEEPLYDWSGDVIRKGKTFDSKPNQVKTFVDLIPSTPQDQLPDDNGVLL